MTRLPPVLVCWLVVAGALSACPPAAAAQSCNETAGRAKAHRYVDQCLMVSPATHPPCNGLNPCPLILDEIRRGCGMLGKDAPGFCPHGKPAG